MEAASVTQSCLSLSQQDRKWVLIHVCSIHLMWFTSLLERQIWFFFFSVSFFRGENQLAYHHRQSQLFCDHNHVWQRFCEKPQVFVLFILHFVFPKYSWPNVRDVHYRKRTVTLSVKSVLSNVAWTICNLCFLAPDFAYMALK